MPALTPQNCLIAPLQLITYDLLQGILRDLIIENEPFIAELNRQQLKQGIRSDGVPITPVYRNNKAGKTGNPDLKDKGDYYKAMFVKVFTDAFELDNSDKKADLLGKKYNESILGLTDDNKQRLIEKIREPFLNRLRAKLGL